MLVAALDTATPVLSCALLEVRGAEVEVLTTRTDRPAGPGPGHGIRLPAALTDLLHALGRKVTDVEGFAIGLGPGSFTGLRIGLATWKGFAYANRRPIAGASSLAAMALESAAALPPGSDALLVPLLDARKGEVYAGFYRRTPDGVAPVLPEEALAPSALAARVSGLGPALAFGEGYEAHRDLLGAVLPPLPGAPTTPGAGAVALLAAPRLAVGGYDDQAVFALEPHYVRKSEAEVKFPNGIP
jgi:tRNA threonylcarbamoyladenosine biosynthesis protein TsaB